MDKVVIIQSLIECKKKKKVPTPPSPVTYSFVCPRPQTAQSGVTSLSLLYPAVYMTKELCVFLHVMALIACLLFLSLTLSF